MWDTKQCQQCTRVHIGHDKQPDEYTILRDFFWIILKVSLKFDVWIWFYGTIKLNTKLILYHTALNNTHATLLHCLTDTFMKENISTIILFHSLMIFGLLTSWKQNDATENPESILKSSSVLYDKHIDEGNKMLTVKVGLSRMFHFHSPH